MAKIEHSVFRAPGIQAYSLRRYQSCYMYHSNITQRSMRSNNFQTTHHSRQARYFYSTLLDLVLTRTCIFRRRRRVLVKIKLIRFRRRVHATYQRQITDWHSKRFCTTRKVEILY